MRWPIRPNLRHGDQSAARLRKQWQARIDLQNVNAQVYRIEACKRRKMNTREYTIGRKCIPAGTQMVKSASRFSDESARRLSFRRIQSGGRAGIATYATYSKPG